MLIYGYYRMGHRGRQMVHAFRGIASTWANEAECCRSDWIEIALKHADEDEAHAERRLVSLLFASSSLPLADAGASGDPNFIARSADRHSAIRIAIPILAISPSKMRSYANVAPTEGLRLGRTIRANG